jgi:FkbM family methyltransferase
VLRYLKRNIEVNHCANVQIVEATVSDSEGTAIFFAMADGTLGPLSPIYGPYTTTVKTVKIDSLVKKKIIPAPDVIKMDTEGGELAALNGAESTLVEHAPTIFLETHGFDMCVDCYHLLASFGYAVLVGKRRKKRDNRFWRSTSSEADLTDTRIVSEIARARNWTV